MLPRKITWLVGTAIFFAISAFDFSRASVFGFSPANSNLSIQELSLKSENIRLSGKFVIQQVLVKTKTKPFSLIGATWTGKLPQNMQIQVKVHEPSGWTTWLPLEYHEDHGPNQAEVPSGRVRSGTDPLVTAVSDGILIRTIGTDPQLPSDFAISLIHSPISPRDRNTFLGARAGGFDRQGLGAVTTKSGAIVNRPEIITRAQWGADESWRDPTPQIGEKIIAGFLHHTATTNSYDPADGPGQMRDLYAYFIKVRKYSDIAYNFLVDRYGVIYEGRAGCPVSASPTCDGPSKPVTGAHTAGMNRNTFAISVMGNFETSKLDSQSAEPMLNSIAALMAWKIAPYNLDPAEIAKIHSSDTTGLSKFPSGTIANVPVISGHRDVGKTVCPGKYLYPYLPEIRRRISGLLMGKIQNLVVSPLLQLASEESPITVTAKIPIAALWNVTVISAESGEVVFTDSGTQKNNADFVYHWNAASSTEKEFPPGVYALSVSATIGQKQLPTETTMITLGSIPSQLTGVRVKRTSKNAVAVSWDATEAAVPRAYAILYRTSATLGKTWSTWKSLSIDTVSKTFTSRAVNKKIYIEIKQVNLMGESRVKRISFISKS